MIRKVKSEPPGWLAVVILIAATLFESRGFAETEYGVAFGPFLPNRIAGVREVLNGLGGHFGIQTSKGFFEFDYYGAHGDGIDYHTVGIDYRMDPIGKEIMPEMKVHFILGFNGDYFKPSTTTEYRQSGGWHYGGGVRVPIGGIQSPFQLRGDFKQRFGPGQSLIVTVGFIFTTGPETAEKP